jgi:hypothetical protein
VSEITSPESTQLLEDLQFLSPLRSTKDDPAGSWAQSKHRGMVNFMQAYLFLAGPQDRAAGEAKLCRRPILNRELKERPH